MGRVKESAVSNRLKCRFCDWTTAKNYTAKDGKFKGVGKAQQRLLDHVEINHRIEWEAVQSALAEQEAAHGQDQE
jgi:hypothetical protein